MTPARSLALIVTGTMLALFSAACRDTDSPPDTQPDTGTKPSASASGPPEAQSAPTILFQRDGTKRTHLALVADDGSGEEALLPDFGAGNQTNPDWSPDGSQVVFAMTDGTTDDLFVADVGATEATKLLDCVSPCLYLDDPAWSPNGLEVVFSRTVDDGGTAASTLETVQVGTGEVHALLGPWSEQFTAGARWSPDGQHIVFELVSKTGPGVDADISGVTLSVLRMRADHRVLSTSDPEILAAKGLTDPALFAATADWSPDGRWIVYSALAEATDEAPDLFRIRSRRGVVEQLTHLVEAGGYAAEPTYTPDGGILFSGGRSADESGLLLALDGAAVAPATGDVVVAGRHPRVKAAAS